MLGACGPLCPRDIACLVGNGQQQVGRFDLCGARQIVLRDCGVGIEMACRMNPWNSANTTGQQPHQRKQCLVTLAVPRTAPCVMNNANAMAPSLADVRAQAKADPHANPHPHPYR